MTIRKSRFPSVAKSVRFPEDVVAFVETFPGENFSEQLINVILTYQKEIPERMKELERLENSLRHREKQLDQIDKRLKQMNEILLDVCEIQPTFEKIRREVVEILNTLPGAVPYAGDVGTRESRRD